MLVLREEKNKNHEQHLKSEEERLGLLARQLDREVRTVFTLVKFGVILVIIFTECQS